MSDASMPWQRADVAVTLELARDLVASVAPSLGEVVYLHEGWDSRAFLVDGEWIFRFPKHASSAARLGSEIALLPRLAPRLLPVAIPHFEYIGQPSERYPYSFVGYRKLPGEPLIQREDADTLDACAIAADLGRFLSALHGVPRDEALAAGVRPGNWYADHVGRATQALNRLHSVRIADTQRERLATLLADVPLAFTAAPVLCHSDIAPEHLLGDAAGSRLVGVIDFGDLTLGDPALDLAGAVLLGGMPALESALQAYTHAFDAEAIRRARFFAALRIPDDLAYGLGDGRPEYVRAGLRALEQFDATGSTRRPA